MILVTGSPFKCNTNFFENNNHIFLKITAIYAQDIGDDFEDGNIFPSFLDGDGDDDFEDGNIFPSFLDGDGDDDFEDGNIFP
ncbi:MAG TPA: hypothetical protein VJ583_11485, partial [Nitrososphaeraceae archaeon]|nr:hypothetical protein [Nitrososphaeraceae archaeon]